MHLSDKVDWPIENQEANGYTLEIVSNNTPEGHQFSRGMGGMIGILHYVVKRVTYDNMCNTFDDDDFM